MREALRPIILVCNLSLSELGNSKFIGQVEEGIKRGIKKWFIYFGTKDVEVAPIFIFLPDLTRKPSRREVAIVVKDLYICGSEIAYERVESEIAEAVKPLVVGKRRLIKVMVEPTHLGGSYCTATD